MNTAFDCFASAAFGMEGLVSRELRSFGLADTAPVNGGVYFHADAEQIFSCNLRMHFSDRLFVVLASETCTSFDSLFHLVDSIEWQRFFSGTESIDVTCKCSRSKLMSPRDCQSITKKAIIEKIKKTTGQRIFPESGPSLPVTLLIRNDHAMVLLNTSGEALSRRGYRTWNGDAPLRETLASALIALSPWKPGMPLHDPCCGTGTILIEAARTAANIAPGLYRSFAMETIRCFQDIDFRSIRNQFNAAVNTEKIKDISGSDLNQDMLELAGRHIVQSGLKQDQIPLQRIALQDLTLPGEKGVFICNPPYGERLNDQKACRALYYDLSIMKQRHPGWMLCAITSDPAFERYFGKRADRKHRLYNGRLECVYYIYHH